MDQQFAFENFVAGDKSQFAYSAALAVAQNPGNPRFNPLFLYGSTGLGKTHLIHAIANKIVTDDPSKKVRVFTADDFVREFVEAAKKGAEAVDALTNLYRNETDVLLMDDVQSLAGKSESQTEFYNIFNALHNAGKQIVLASDVPLSEIKDISDRLVSRFAWGLTVDIKAPDVDSRESILRKKAEECGLVLEEDVVKYLAESIEGSVRAIESAVNKLYLISSLRNQAIDMQTAVDVVGEIVPNIRRRVGIDSIIQTVAHRFEISPNKLLEPGRGTKEVSHARQIAMYLMKHLSNLSLKSIGMRFGNRDHSTVIHAIRIIEREVERDPSFARQMESLKSLVKD